MLTMRSSSASASALRVSTERATARSFALSVAWAGSAGAASTEVASGENERERTWTSSHGREFIAHASRRRRTGRCGRNCGLRRRWQDERKLVSRYYAPPTRWARTPTHLSVIPAGAPSDLVENSAAAMSMTQPGIFFTINDSGNEPLLFALDTANHDRGVWRIANANNVDWEAAAVGPCSAGAAAWCVYIGDVGDNEARHRSRKIYRVAEPRALESGAGRRDSLEAERLTFDYPNGPQDVEAMYVARNGDVFLIAKRPRLDAARRPLTGARVPDSGERMAKGAHRRRGARGQPTDRAGQRTVPPHNRRGAVTGREAPRGAHLYAALCLRHRLGGGRVNHEIAPAVCNLLTVDEVQGEGLTWADNRGRFVFTTEGRRAPIALADCPVPR